MERSRCKEKLYNNETLRKLAMASIAITACAAGIFCVDKYAKSLGTNSLNNMVAKATPAPITDTLGANVTPQQPIETVPEPALVETPTAEVAQPSEAATAPTEQPATTTTPTQPRSQSAPVVKPAASVTKPVQKPAAKVPVIPKYPTAGLSNYDKDSQGRKVCVKGNHDDPSMSSKGKGTHIDEDCCIDPDEIPNGACYYPSTKNKDITNAMAKAKKNAEKASKKKNK